jgi:hypothetical protein
MINFTVISINIDEDADGTRTAPGGYLDSGKCPAYRGFWWHRCRHDRQCGGGRHAGEQRVLRASASGRRVSDRVGHDDLHPDRQRIRDGNTDDHADCDDHADAHAHDGNPDPHANPDYLNAYAYANPDYSYGYPHANPHHADADAHAHVPVEHAGGD